MSLALLLGGLAGLLLLVAASAWLAVFRRVDSSGRGGRAELPVAAISWAAQSTALALGLAGIASIAAFTARFW